MKYRIIKHYPDNNWFDIIDTENEEKDYIVFEGKLSDCEAWLRLNDMGYKIY